VQLLLLLFIHILLFKIFILATAFEGVFLIPVISLTGMPLAFFQPEYSLLFKSIVLVLASLCILVFIRGLKRNETWQGKLTNIAGFYLWCAFGLCASQQHYWTGN
jgi:hypothetical protein